jgi:hypothetical protein
LLLSKAFPSSEKETPYSEKKTPYSKKKSCYSEKKSPSCKKKSCSCKKKSPSCKKKPPYSKKKSCYSEKKTPYSKKLFNEKESRPWNLAGERQIFEEFVARAQRTGEANEKLFDLVAKRESSFHLEFKN